MHSITYHAFWKRFAKEIKDVRQQRGLTQAQLGDMVSYSHQSICAVEQGRLKPGLYEAAVLCSALGVHLSVLARIMPERERSRAGAESVEEA